MYFSPREKFGRARAVGFQLFFAATLISSIGLQAQTFGNALADYLDGNTDNALQQMRSLASDGDVEAMLFLAEDAQRQFIFQPGSEPPTEFFARAAARGSAQAKFRLGEIFLQSAIEERAVSERDDLFASARRWFRSAAEQGHVGAAFSLAKLIKDGIGGPSNNAEALNFFTVAAEAGYPGAGVEVGLLLIRQNDFDAALPWISAEADVGDPIAQTVLSEMYLHGLGVQQSDSLSLQWVERAADAGNFAAQRDLAARYWAGIGVPQNKDLAISLLQSSAEGGNSFAQVTLGKMHYRGLHVPLDYVVARQYFSAAADRGSLEGLYYLAQMVQYAQGSSGVGVGSQGSARLIQNYRDAIELYTTAAEGGYVPAQLALARLYDGGISAIRDLERALFWYQAAADLGDAEASRIASIMFSQGQGVPRFDDGPITYFDHLPTVLFLTGSIGLGDFAKVNAAIDRFNPSIIVLNSPGGVVGDAIQIADLIASRGIGTFVPAQGQCLSACVYIFTAGLKRYALGDIGVHQLQAAQADASVPIGDLQAIISQIIVALNRYGVPPFMIERILGSRDMYFLSVDERTSLGRDSSRVLELFNPFLLQSVFEYQFL